MKVTESDINKTRELLLVRVYGSSSSVSSELRADGLIKTTQITRKGADLIMRVFESLAEEKIKDLYKKKSTYKRLKESLEVSR